jgi:(2Fe-2S) ferredoxin
MSEAPDAVPLQATRSLVLVARASVTAAADRELDALCERLRERHPGCDVCFAYTEQGEPALRRVLHQLADRGLRELLLLPLLLPLEPGFALSLQRVIKRWRRERDPHRPGAWPEVRIAPAPSELRAIDTLLDAMTEGAAAAPPSDGARAPEADGATVPAQRHRVLVCAGAPCTDAGAHLVWGHLRNIQKARSLRTEGPGVMSCKTTCLGPCGLAPVVQVWPDGTWYGGVDEVAIERIVQEHLLGGRPVADWAYTVQPGKQRLRMPTDPAASPR